MPKKAAKAAKRSSKRKTTKKGIGVRDLETKAHVKGGPWEYADRARAHTRRATGGLAPPPLDRRGISPAA